MTLILHICVLSLSDDILILDFVTKMNTHQAGLFRFFMPNRLYIILKYTNNFTKKKKKKKKTDRPV
ncbi:hypothetical protein Hanom_Chr12g01129981 [Helianthus anomalus]